jgi:hypothetical protein
VENNFDKVKGIVETNLDFLEQIALVNFKHLDKDCKAFIYSQLRRTAGIIGKIILDGK